jgi:ankyrin repeat protein
MPKNVGIEFHDDEEKLFKAVFEQDVSEIKHLVKNKKVNVNATDVFSCTALLSAATYILPTETDENKIKKAVEVINLLSELGADIEARAPWGETALGIATMRGHTQIYQALFAAKLSACSEKAPKKTQVTELEENLLHRSSRHKATL